MLFELGRPQRGGKPVVSKNCKIWLQNSRILKNDLRIRFLKTGPINQFFKIGLLGFENVFCRIFCIQKFLSIKQDGLKWAFIYNLRLYIKIVFEFGKSRRGWRILFSQLIRIQLHKTALTSCDMKHERLTRLRSFF